MTDSTSAFGIWARPGIPIQAQYIQKLGEELLTQLGFYTDISYFKNNSIWDASGEMTKLDMAIVPNLASSFMGNWGLMTNW